MDDLEEKVLGVLNDPEKLAQVMDIAKGLGLSPAEDGGEAAPRLPDLHPTASDSRREALLQALAPYLQPARRQKLQRAIEVARLSNLARFALQQKPEQETAGEV